MVASDKKSSVHSVKLSSVVPARVTGDNTVHGLTSMDLAMKLHYLKGLYFFSSEAVQGLTIADLKKPMFQGLELYPMTSGRIRQSESDRPVIKCNDSGVRIIEARCDKSLDEWLAATQEEDGGWELQDLLAHSQVLGPDLGFSPLIYVQFTWFECGGICVGLSWAHVLGDAFSASSFINMWGQIMAGHAPPKSLHAPVPKWPSSPGKSTLDTAPLTVKRVDPVGDCWLAVNNSKLEAYSVHLTLRQLDHITSICGLVGESKVPHFELLSALIWKSVSKIRGDGGPKIVTVCENNVHREVNQLPSNSMDLSRVEVNFSVAEAEVSDLARLITEAENENGMIEEMVEKDEGKLDFIAYGANLTFVNLDGADIYGLELQGRKPIFANYRISGVGDEGVVLVLPGPENGDEKGGGGLARTVTMVLPEAQMAQLKEEINGTWGILPQ
ncbi:protein ECERIFERUM 2 [Rhodamnia argentea]|uniref:Protein ECERIFERUM 2 n=1 Tax=Rhodamnia argentea TaxID=178133 RepID=A0A8B8Q6R6_9MYRT|nr:protein ECERIFERUM 2 [Rhodamnia argentea]